MAGLCDLTILQHSFITTIKELIQSNTETLNEFGNAGEDTAGIW